MIICVPTAGRERMDASHFQENQIEKIKAHSNLTSQVRSVLSKTEIAPLPKMTLNQQNCLAQIASQQQEVLDRNSEAIKRLIIINKIAANKVLTTEPVGVQCQFCQQNVTTKIELGKLIEINKCTAEEKDRQKLLRRLILLVPCFWPWLPCYLICAKVAESAAVAYHQCPNCSNWIAISTNIPTFSSKFSTISGTKEEQLAELINEIQMG